MHNNSMELEDVETHNLLNDMIRLLQDGKELAHRQEAQAAVKELQKVCKYKIICIVDW